MFGSVAEIGAVPVGQIVENRAENTTRAYANDWRSFEDWCRSVGERPLPTTRSVVLRYLDAMAADNFAWSTLARRASSIAYYHREAGHEPPNDRAVTRWLSEYHAKTGGILRQSEPVTPKILRRIEDRLGDSLADRRDWAMLTMGVGGRMKRYELSGLDAGRVVERRHGIHVGDAGIGLIPKGHDPALCPVRAWRAWVDASGIESGRLFVPITRHGTFDPNHWKMSGHAVNAVVKRRVESIGLDPDDYSGESLQKGYESWWLERESKATPAIEEYARRRAKNEDGRADRAYSLLRKCLSVVEGAQSDANRRHAAALRRAQEALYEAEDALREVV